MISDLPTNEVALTLAPSTLAGAVLLRFLARWRESNKVPLTFGHVCPNWHDVPEDVQLAYAEAWNWLCREGFLLPDITPLKAGLSDSMLPSRRARKISTLEEFQHIANAALLPRELLHDGIRIEVENNYYLGRYDNCVFDALRLLEIAVRKAAPEIGSDSSVDLMRRVFKPNGPLADPSMKAAESIAQSELFAGAMGSYSNSTRHRIVGLSRIEALQVLVLASHLLSMVEKRIGQRQA